VGALRLFLAYGVFLDHDCHQLANYGLACDPRWAFNILGGRSVYFFYIVSGFLISYVLEGKYSRARSGTYDFYKSRFLRIYPLWWVVVAVCAYLAAAAWPTNPFQVLGAIVLFGSDWSAFMRALGYLNVVLFPPLSEIGWTLGAELAFYLLAPWLLRSNRIALIVFAGSSATRIVAYYAVGPHAETYVAWSYAFLPATFMFFLLGHFARCVPWVDAAGLWPSGALLVAVLVLSYYGDPVTDDGRISYSAAVMFAVALPGIFAATKNNRIYNWLGDLTYPLYLFHGIVLAQLFATWPFIGSPGVMLLYWVKTFPSQYQAGATLFAVSLAICLLAALLVHVLCETPMRSLCSQVVTLAENSVARLRSRLRSAAPLTADDKSQERAAFEQTSVDPALSR
jgi:peptidoglycan/LPS O-acetylase OafA/YrhL